MPTLDDIARRAFAALRPPRRVPLAEWIEAHIRLPEGATPGPVQLHAFQRGIAEAIGDPAIERVTVVKSVRAGFTTLVTCAVASYASVDPSPILVLLPAEADARDYVRSDLEPLFEATPATRGLLAPGAEGGERNTMLYRRFPGGSIKVVAARAPRNLRRHTARVLFVDEADAMVMTPEGCPIALAERRTLSFPDRKIVVGSTPTDEATSHVLRLYAQSDQRVFEVPCPECGGFTEILWQHIEWEPDRPETAAFRCPHCSALVPERCKPAMVAKGRWRITAPAVACHAGFRINALVSPHPAAAWGKLAEEFLRVKADSERLRVFVNTILAEPWRTEGDEVDDIELAARAEDFSLAALPAEVLSLTAGVDVQDDRLEVTFVGWDRGDRAYVLAHDVIWGGPEEDETWRALDELLRRRYAHPLGGEIGVDAAIVDSGSWTDRVYAFCFPRWRRRVWAGKGVAGSRPAFALSPSKVRGGGRLILVGVDTIKTALFARLARGRSIRFSRSLDAAWYEQLASERRIVRLSRGRPVVRFERLPGARAEALDCVVYAFAAHAGASIPAGREDELRGAPVVEAPRVIRSSWLQRAS